MKKKFYSEAVVESDEGIKFKISYYLIIEEVSRINGDLLLEIYGINVLLENGNNDECTEIYNITVDVSKIFGLLKLLCENQVTPTTVFDVVSDWMNLSK